MLFLSILNNVIYNTNNYKNVLYNIKLIKNVIQNWQCKFHFNQSNGSNSFLHLKIVSFFSKIKNWQKFQKKKKNQNCVIHKQTIYNVKLKGMSGVFYQKQNFIFIFPFSLFCQKFFPFCIFQFYSSQILLKKKKKFQPIKWLEIQYFWFKLFHL